jgi:hypothetical protein
VGSSDWRGRLIQALPMQNSIMSNHKDRDGDLAGRGSAYQNAEIKLFLLQLSSVFSDGDMGLQRIVGQYLEV